MARLLAPAFLALVLALPAVPCGGANQGIRAMTASATLARHLESLPDAALLHRDQSAIDTLPLMAARLGFDGLLLAAPKRIDWARDQALPALLLSGVTASRERALNWHRNTIVLATDVDRGVVYANATFPRREGKSPDTAELAPDQPPTSQRPAAAPSAIPPPPEPAAIGTAWLALPTLLRLPTQTMRLAVRVIYYDQVSNGATIQAVGADPAAGPRPMADGLAVMGRLAAAGQRPSGLPVFKRSTNTPELTAPGLSVRVGRIGSALALHAALRLTATAPMLLSGGDSASSPNGRPLPAALVRATIVLVQRDQPSPLLAPIEFPVWSARALSIGDTLDAAFSVDLADHLPASALQPGAQVYLVAGPHLAGPIALAR